MQLPHLIRCFHGMAVHEHIAEAALEGDFQSQPQDRQRKKTEYLHFGGRQMYTVVRKRSKIFPQPSGINRGIHTCFRKQYRIQRADYARPIDQNFILLFTPKSHSAHHNAELSRKEHLLPGRSEAGGSDLSGARYMIKLVS